MLSYAERMSALGRFGEIEELLVRIGAGEFLAQMAGGILMSQGELVRPADLGLDAKAVAARFTGVSKTSSPTATRCKIAPA